MTANLRPVGKVRIGQLVYVRRRYHHPPYEHYYQRGLVEIVRRHEVVVRVRSYELTAAYADLFQR